MAFREQNTHSTKRAGVALAFLLVITAGRFWVDYYGSADDPEEFKALMAYSPCHNLKPGTRYPATLISLRAYGTQGATRINEVLVLAIRNLVGVHEKKTPNYSPIIHQLFNLARNHRKI